MFSNCKVLYKGTQGVMAFEKKKVVFQHRSNENDIKVGLGVIDLDSYVDKGNYAFATMQNIVSVLPDTYATVDFFENKGVPIKIQKGVYGDSTFIKEDYADKSFIKAYDAVGNTLLYENKAVKNKDFTGLNMYYCRLENTVGTWVDITDEVASAILESIVAKKCDLDIMHSYIFMYTMKGLKKNKVVKLSNGVIMADGKHETLVFWGEGDTVRMAWLGRRLDLSENEDITAEVAKILENSVLS